VACSLACVAPTGQHCPSNGPGAGCPDTPTSDWNYLPTNSLNHDINGIAIDAGPSNCAVYEAADFGVYKVGSPSPAQPCGDPSAWTVAGNAGAGFGALQIFQIAGHVQFPITGGGWNITGWTSLFIGTMDNGLWGIFDALPGSTWQCFQDSPASCEPEGSFLQVSQQAFVRQRGITFDSIDKSAMMKLDLDEVTGLLSQDTVWTTLDPPGDGA